MMLRRLHLVALLCMVAATACTSTASPSPTTTAKAANTDYSVQLRSSATAGPGPVRSTASIEPTATPPSNQAPTTSTSPISLGQPPSTYTLSHYILCGKQFVVPSLQNLWIYPDVPKVLHHTPGSDFGLVLVIGGDCGHGGLVSFDPSANATLKPLIVAAEGRPLVVEVLTAIGKTGTVHFVPAGGPAVMIPIV